MPSTNAKYYLLNKLAKLITFLLGNLKIMLKMHVKEQFT